MREQTNCSSSVICDTSFERAAPDPTPATVAVDVEEEGTVGGPDDDLVVGLSVIVDDDFVVVLPRPFFSRRCSRSALRRFSIACRKQNAHTVIRHRERNCYKTRAVQTQTSNARRRFSS